MVEGSGAMIRDADGNWLLDACSGTVVMNLGHGPPRRGGSARRTGPAADPLLRFRHPDPGSTSSKPSRRSCRPASTPSIWPNSGSEAVESALRTVRSATGRHEVIAFHNAYHGRTLGALSLTAGAGREGLGTAAAGRVARPGPPTPPRPRRPAKRNASRRAGGISKRLASQVLTGPPAAVFIEPMQGAGGMIPVPAGFLELLRSFCDRTGALLVFDEILTGGGRTGRFWAFEHSGVAPRPAIGRQGHRRRLPHRRGGRPPPGNGRRPGGAAHPQQQHLRRQPPGPARRGWPPSPPSSTRGWRPTPPGWAVI